MGDLVKTIAKASITSNLFKMDFCVPYEMVVTLYIDGTMFFIVEFLTYPLFTDNSCEPLGDLAPAISED
jgi:hypothetical protein